MFKRKTDKDRVVDAVVALWNRNSGWIPGASYQDLADALGVDVSRLSHWDREARRRVGPPEHVHHAGLSVIDGAEVFGQCSTWVDGVRCAEMVRAR